MGKATGELSASYETRQVERATRDALHKYPDPAEAARAYGLDVRKMLVYDPAYWDANGLIRLYARIAVHLAVLALPANTPPGGPTTADTYTTDEHCQYCGNSWTQTRTVGTPRLDAVPCPKCKRLV